MAREQFTLGSSDDLLGELYGHGPTEGEHEDDTPPPPVEQTTDTRRKGGKPVSNTARTQVREQSDKSAAEASATPPTSTTRTPAGMRRHTVYIAAAVADELDATAERLVSELHGTVPKHVVLGELITMGIASADEVARRIRARLIAELQG